MTILLSGNFVCAQYKRKAREDPYLCWEREFGAERCLTDSHPHGCRCYIIGRQLECPGTVEAERGVQHHATKAAASENRQPVGQAARWFADVLATPMGEAGTEVARQLARLCGHDSVVTTTTRSLADAVGQTDVLGRQRAFAERGVASLADAGLIEKAVIGEGRFRRTAFYLLPIDPHAYELQLDGDEGEFMSWAA